MAAPAENVRKDGRVRLGHGTINANSLLEQIRRALKRMGQASGKGGLVSGLI